MPFDSFLGNTEAVTAVRRMLSSGRVPGSMLFTGPDGVGKKTLALMLGKALNCERLKDDFCGQCARCRKAEEMLTASRDDLARRRETKDAGRRVEALLYFDLQLVEPLTRFILIEQIRQLRQIAYTRPFEFQRRVFVIDQAQAIHWQAVDLLLKALEEPPETTTIILVCPNAHELRPTIRSRCRRIQFASVEESVIVELLARENRFSKSQRPLAARLAAGSVGKALTLDLDAYLEQRQLWLEFLESFAGRAAGSSAGSDRTDWRTLFDATKALTEHREEFEDRLSIGYTLLRDLMLVVEGGGQRELSDPDLLPRLKTCAARLGVSGVAKLKDGLDQAYRLQTRNVNQQLGLETLAIDLIERSMSPSEVAEG